MVEKFRRKRDGFAIMFIVERRAVQPQARRRYLERGTLLLPRKSPADSPLAADKAWNDLMVIKYELGDLPFAATAAEQGAEGLLKEILS